MIGGSAIGQSVPVDGLQASFRLLPAGLFRSSDSRPAGIAGWLMNGVIAAKLIQQVRATVSDIVIDYEHQTLQAEKNGKPAPAAGWFGDMEWREGDGLYATDVKWTEAAAHMVKAKEYRYISPVFIFDPHSGEVQRIVSAALTNSPALDGLTDLAAATRKNLNDTPGDIDYERVLEVLRHSFGPDAVIPAANIAAATSEDHCNTFGRIERERAAEALRNAFGSDACIPAVWGV